MGFGVSTEILSQILAFKLTLRLGSAFLFRFELSLNFGYFDKEIEFILRENKNTSCLFQIMRLFLGLGLESPSEIT